VNTAHNPGGQRTVLLEPPPHSNADPQINISGVVLIVVAVLASIAAAYLGRGLLVPIVLALLVSYALEPAVRTLGRHHVPRVLGSGIVLGILCCGIGWTVYQFSDEAAQVVHDLPDAIRNIRQTILHARRSGNGPVSQLNQAAKELEQAAVAASGSPQRLPGAASVQIVQPPLNLQNYLVWGSMGAAAIAGQILLLIFLVYFLLASGDLFKRKLIKLAGPSLEKKRVTARVLDEISDKIAHFLLHLLIANAVVAMATGFAFWWIGMEHPALWGIMAGILNTLPYFGPILMMLASTIVALLQGGPVQFALLAGGVSLVITSAEGYLLTPWLMGQATRMNAVAVFVGILFWGWLWGIWGAMLAVPILVVIKTIADHIDDLSPVAEFLGE
jgi:predicted PurR-regulated permease PerM